MSKSDPPMAWGSGTSVEEIDAARTAICDGQSQDTLITLIREDGVFIGFEVAKVGSSEPPRLQVGTTAHPRRRHQ